MLEPYITLKLIITGTVRSLVDIAYSQRVESVAEGSASSRSRVEPVAEGRASSRG